MNLSSHNFNFHALRNACMDASSPLPTAEELVSIPNGYFRLDRSGNPIYKWGDDLLPFGGSNSNIELGDRKYTAFQIKPENPSLGDYWDEIDASNLLIAEWFWNGVYWLSRGKPEQVVSPRSTLASGATGSTVGVSQISFGTIPNANIFIDSWGVSGIVSAATSSANYYSFEPRIIVGNTLTTIPGVAAKNINQALAGLSTFYLLFPNINAHYIAGDGAFATGVAATVNRFGTVPGINGFTHFLNYRYARK